MNKLRPTVQAPARHTYTHMHTYINTYIHTDIQIYRQTETDRQTDRQTDRGHSKNHFFLFGVAEKVQPRQDFEIDIFMITILSHTYYVYEKVNVMLVFVQACADTGRCSEIEKIRLCFAKKSTYNLLYTMKTLSTE
jgi:hypothetical protein